MSAFGKHGVRCDWCGKFSKNRIGEYTKLDGISAGYIRQAQAEDDGRDICEECAANRLDDRDESRRLDAIEQMADAAGDDTPEPF